MEEEVVMEEDKDENHLPSFFSLPKTLESDLGFHSPKRRKFSSNLSHLGRPPTQDLTPPYETLIHTQ